MRPLRADDPKSVGHYVLSDRLPEGPRGTTFLGRESDDAPLRVIKVLAGEPDPNGVARFTGVRRVSGLHVAKMVDAGLHEGCLYVVREHVRGRSLAETLAADGPLNTDALERMAVGTLTALTAAHLVGVTHRGLTPHNVIMGVDGVRVTDLDLGEAAGEIGYHSPEQLRDEPYGSAADLFAWAATVVFAATGKAPFGHDAEAVLTGAPALGALTEPLRGVVLAALAKDADPRPTTYDALLRLLGGQYAEPGITAALSPAKAPPKLPLYEQPAPSPTPGDGAPIEGVPVRPQSMPLQQPQQSWQPPQPPGGSAKRPQMLQAPVVGTPAPRRKFPIAMAASAAGLMVLSGVAIWGAGHYTETRPVNSVGVGAAGEADRGIAALIESEQNAQTGAGDPVPQLGPESGRPQPEVTVPWATSSATDQDGVGPLILPTEQPSDVPTAPVYSTVPTPSPTSTQPVSTVQPTTTSQKTPQPTATPATQTALPQVTKTVTATPTASDTATRTPQRSQDPTPSPTRSSETPAPSMSTQAPAPAPTTQSPTTQPPRPEPPRSADPPPPPPAQAEPKNPYAPAQVCGAGFYVQRSQSFSGGETFQLYNAGTEQNCVVTMKYAGVGKESPVSATLDVQGGGSATDSGNFKYYAGPVKLDAPGKCVKFSGSVGAEGTSADWANCG